MIPSESSLVPELAIARDAARRASPWRLGARPLPRIARALLSARHWRGAVEALRVYRAPLPALLRYLSGRGAYPAAIGLRTPTGPAEATLHTHADMLTLHEVFCRRDYAMPGDVQSVLDWGANIGITALHALTRNRAARVIAYEPLPRNAARLRRQLAPHAGRWRLHQAAIGFADGQAQFGAEPTGRYGGLGRTDLPERIAVPVRAANAALAEALAEFGGSLDLLKIDIEGMEAPILRALDPALLARVRLIVAETKAIVPLAGFAPERAGSVVRYRH
ncbi:MAG: FkbM family methyltransferase [Alphaproteobacteria bacterium]|nr:FkbM family methyltransferase [Alphaproteobacteria bacterium]